MELIIIDELEIWPEDLGKMNWHQAMERVKELGPGWRLPTIEELEETLYPNQDRIPNLENSSYWSSSEINANLAWSFNFNYGYARNSDKNYTIYVRAVKTFDGESALGILLKDF